MAREISVQLKISTPKIAEEIKRILSSLDGFYLNPSKLLESGDLLIFEMGEIHYEGIQSLHSMRSSGRVREIFVISTPLSPDLLIQTRRAGADRVFVQPLKITELRSALLEFKEGIGKISSSPKYQQYGKMIYVLGCKGGVGTTTVAVNLASALARLDPSRAVVLADMSGPFGDMQVLLDIHSSPDWVQMIKNLPRINKNNLKGILHKHSSGFYVLPSPPGPQDGAVDPEVGEQIVSLTSLMEKVFEFLVIDGGKNVESISSRIFEMTDTVLLVTNLSHPCMENMKKLFPFFQEMQPYPEDKVKILVNRIQKNSSFSPEDAEKELKKHVFWKIPNDFLAVTEAANQGKTLLDLKGGKEIRDSFTKLAAFFLMKESPDERKNHFWNKLLGKSRLATLSLPLLCKLNTS